jgi:hypothetical protein
MDTADESRMADHIEHLKAEMARNEETISSLRDRNIDIIIRLIAFEHGISVGDVVRTPDGTQYIVKKIGTERWRRQCEIKPWILVNPHTKDGIGWDKTTEINLYANWEKVS